MLKKRWAWMLPGTLVLAAFAHNAAGGWAVVSIQDLPDYAVVGEPLRLTYAVRQHGEDLLGGLNGKLTARSRAISLEVAAKESPERGVYNTVVTLPNAGEWTLSITSGFRGKSNTTLLPIRAVARGSEPPALGPEERGKRLFVAKGCVTCHTHSESKSEIGDAAPDLTGKTFAPTYLADFLANPKIKPAAKKNGWQMPNPGLKQPEIAALVAFINSNQRITAAK